MCSRLIFQGWNLQVSEQACAMLRDGILSSAPSERRACLVREVTIRDRGPAGQMGCNLGVDIYGIFLWKIGGEDMCSL